ncbi:MAG: hypothetical protein IE909_16160 [Campylobacterales bacterium]|nr:hypothetical protein [Campylobacterales bacterium]
MSEIEIMTKLLFDKFGKIALNPEEAAMVLGSTTKSLEKDRAEAIGIPFTRRNNKDKGQVMYAITSIAKTLVENQKKVV